MFAAVVPLVFASASESIPEQYRLALLTRLLPQPRQIEFFAGHCILNDQVALQVATAMELPASEQDAVRKSCGKIAGFAPTISFVTDKATENFADEQYAVSVQDKKIVIRSRAFRGVDHALKTLRQLTEPVRGTAKTTFEMVPLCEISDAPAMEFRAIHLCISTQTDMTTMIRNLRLAAYYKYNYAIIESWGVFPFQSHPEFAWKDRKKSREEFIALRDAARECGITIIPQFNIFGHASMSRVISAKHAVLDFYPEFSPVFEPSGWSFCLTNPAARQIIADLVTELHDFYGRPPFFHLGCDEAYDFQTCAECAKCNGSELIARHITFFHDLLQKRGARSIIWHDMLFQKSDPRWQGCTATGRASDIPDRLPSDIIIADWEYNFSPEWQADHEWATSIHLQGKGFDVAVCPWFDVRATNALVQMAARHKMFGVIATTWNRFYGRKFFNIIRNPVMVAWYGRMPDVAPSLEAIARHIRQIAQEMGIARYENFGVSREQNTEVLQ